MGVTKLLGSNPVYSSPGNTVPFLVSANVSHSFNSYSD